MLEGRCHCGHVRYEAHGTPFNATVCHCADCRRAAGAPIVGWFSIPRSGYRVVAGEPALYASSPGVERSFCPRCGTSLTYASARHPEEIDVTMASLEDPAAMPPADQVLLTNRLPWIFTLPDLPVRKPRP